MLHASDKPSHIRIHSIGGQQGTAFGVWFWQMFPHVGIFLDNMAIRIDCVHHDLLRMELVNKLMERSLVARLASVNRNARVYFSGSNVMAISFVVDIALQNNSLPSSLIRSACNLIETERDILTVKGVMPSV